MCGIFLHNGSVTNMSTESLKSSCVCLLSWSMLICQPGRVVCTLPCVPNFSTLLKLEWKWLYQLARRDSPGPFPITFQSFFAHCIIVTFTLIILWIQIILGLNKFTAMTHCRVLSLRSRMIIEMLSQARRRRRREKQALTLNVSVSLKWTKEVSFFCVGFRLLKENWFHKMKKAPYPFSDRSCFSLLLILLGQEPSWDPRVTGCWHSDPHYWSHEHQQVKCKVLEFTILKSCKKYGGTSNEHSWEHLAVLRIRFWFSLNVMSLPFTLNSK